MSSHATSNPRLAASGSLSHNERLLEGEITQFALDMKKLINQKDSAYALFTTLCSASHFSLAVSVLIEHWNVSGNW